MNDSLSTDVDPTQHDGATEILDAIVIGAGFGGLYMLHELRENGFKAVAIEAGTDVGGAWYWNRYPGARCDVESLVYCYSFSPIIDAEWRWTERYAAQPEIQRYLSFVCDRLELRRSIHFQSRVSKASFDEVRDLWTIKTEQGAIYQARYFISAAGPLTAPIWPEIPGRETFEGTLYHSALWPRDRAPDFSGQRVGVIGTGSSGTQLIPLVAEQASELTVFVRTPNMYVPAFNRPLTEDDHARWREVREQVRERLGTFEVVGSGDIFMDEDLVAARRQSGHAFTPEERRAILDQRWKFGGASAPRAFSDVATDQVINGEVSAYLREKSIEAIQDPSAASILAPHLAYGTKRVTVGTNFYETFNRPNVKAVDVAAAPIERFTANGLVVDGEEIALDAIICASGFDAVTGALTAIDLRGVDGQTMKDAWSDKSDTYLGLGIAGFPNLLVIGGPGSPSVLVNVAFANEYQVDWIRDMLLHMRAQGLTRLEVEAEAQERWALTVQSAIKGTVLEHAKSWFTGANVPGKAQGILAYAGGITSYMRICDDAATQGYAGFRLSRLPDVSAPTP
jgi:cyclohexanone monooxygenase